MRYGANLRDAFLQTKSCGPILREESGRHDAVKRRKAPSRTRPPGHSIFRSLQRASCPGRLSWLESNNSLTYETGCPR